MTGDWRPHPDGFHYAAELVREAVARGGFCIAVAGFPEVHPRAVSRASDLGYLKEKVEAGADVIITQLFFDNDDYYRYVDDVRRLGVMVPVVPGVYRSFQRLKCAVSRRSARRKSAGARRGMAKVEQDDAAAVEAGVDYATRQCEGLIKFGVPGLHFYSLNKSYSCGRFVKTSVFEPAWAAPRSVEIE